jgi:hypothetical protein
MLATFLLLAGVAIGIRFLVIYLSTDGYTGHIQSLILAAILTIAAFLMVVVGVLGDLVAGNRRLIEDVRFRLIQLEERLHELKQGTDDNER